MKNIESLVNPHILSLVPYQPGKPIETLAKEIGMEPSHIAKLASNESPIGPSPRAMRAMRNAIHEMHLYPDGASLKLVAKLAEHYKLPENYFAIGNGSNELIELLGHAFLNPDNGVVMSQYAFAVYKLVAALFNAPCTEVSANIEFGHDLSKMLKASKGKKNRLIFICNPNNPTGTALSLTAIKEFMENVGENKIVAIDEAYAEVAIRKRYKSAVELVKKYPNLVILRTFSKGYGLAGLRIGYAIAQPKLIRAINLTRQPFNISRMAQIAATAALDDQIFVRNVKNHCAVEVEKYYAFCKRHNLRYIPTFTNFILVHVGDGKGFFQALEKEGLIIRPMAAYQLPEWVRISFGSAPENDRLIAAMDHIMNKRTHART